MIYSWEGNKMEDNMHDGEHFVKRDTLQALSDSGLLKVSTCDAGINLSDDTKFKKLETGSAHNTA